MINDIFKIFIIIMLLIISIIDIKKMIIPDYILLVGFITSLIYLVFSKNIYLENIFGSFIGFVIFLAIAFITNAMGGGDIKLMALLGFIFGVKGVLFITVFSFIIGAIISVILLILKLKEKNDFIAFGPFISVSTFIYIFYGNIIIEYYIKILS